MDAITKETIPNATVYYDQTFEGTTTNQDGKFQLDILKNRPLSISAIGYYSTSISDYSNLVDVEIFLEPKIYEIGEVSVNSESLEKIRVRNLRIFKKHFIGTTPNARKCRILNEDDITFNYNENSDTLKAYALKPIQIENRALGYRISYYLDKFEYSGIAESSSTSFLGSYIFNEDLSKTDVSNKSYERKRKYAYYGSRMHFVRSLCLDSLHSVDFEIRDQSYYILEIKDLVYINNNLERYLKNIGNVIIWYDGNRRSSIRFKTDSVLIDKTGYYSAGIIWSGDMSNIRIADLLPYEYLAEPEISKIQPSDIATKLVTYCKRTHPEKLFVNSDRNIYAAGDTIWFSSWLLNADNFSPEQFEKILYVDIIDNNGSIISQNLFTIDQGRCLGQIALDQELSNGHYQLLAYTNYMKNQGIEFLFKKTIVIQTNLPVISNAESLSDQQNVRTLLYSNAEKSLIPQQKQVSDINISFFPEGGNWVVGIPSRIAFIGNQNGNDSLQFSGNIYDNKDNLIAILKSEFNGRGTFQMTPQPNTQYYTKVTDHLGQTAKFSLPPPDIYGHTLSVHHINNDSLLNIIIHSSKHNIGNSELILTITQHQSVIIEHRFNPTQKELLITIPKSDLETGIAQVTLFDSDLNLLCERLAFINHNDFLKFNIETTNTSKYEPSKIDLYITDKNNNPVNGVFSLSLTKGGYYSDTTFTSPNMVQYLYLNSELPGLEKQCNYFFLNDRISQYKTDLTLLTNGWRRFTWKDVLMDSIPNPQFPLEQKLYIAGIVKDEKTAVPISNVEISLMGLGKSILAGTATTNDSGKFVFMIDSYDGILDVTIQTKNDRNKKKDYTIELQTNLGTVIKKKSLNNRLVIQSSDLSVVIDTIKTNLPTHKPNEAENVLITPFNQDIYFNDTTDINLDEVIVNAKRILTPQEKIHSIYGPSSLTISKQQLEAINESEKWNYGLISVLDKIIPGMVTSNKSSEAKHMFDGVIKGLSTANSGDNPCGPGRIPLCCCDSLEQKECYYDPSDCYQFVYNGTSYFRLYFYVDGRLCAFTNHQAQIDWARNNLINMSLNEIESIVFIQHPKRKALMDAFSVSKRYEELYCKPITGAHIVNNCMYGFDSAPEHIISITTKSGLGISSSRKFKGIANTKMVGFTRVREFYEPVNDSSKVKLALKSPTLYWNPDIKTDEEGKASIELSNNLMNAEYNISINGMSSNNIPGSFQTVIENSSGTRSKVVSDSLVDITIKSTKGTLCNYTEISITNEAIIDQTSANSIFTIHKEDLQKCDTLNFSVPGWGNSSITIQELTDENFIVNIPYQVAQVDTIDNLQKLMKLVFSKQLQNRPLRAFDLKGVFQQRLYSGNELLGLTDFSFIQRKKEVGNVSDTHFNNINQVHQFRVQNYSAKAPFELLSQQSDFLPRLDPTNMDLSFMKDELFDKYQIKYIGDQQFNERDSYVITFEPNPNDPLAIYAGMMIIDKTTYALSHVQWHVPDTKKKMVAWGNYIAPQKKQPVFGLIADMHHATYVIEGDKWKLKSASQQLSFSSNGTIYSVLNETVITKYLDERTKQLRRTIPNRMNGKSALNQKVLYNPGRWRQNDVLLPDNKTQIQIKGLYEHTVFE